MKVTTHYLDIREKLFFLFSGAVISIPFPLLVDSVAGILLMQDLHDIWAIIIPSVFLAPILEEFTKAYPLFFRHGETERSIMTLGFYAGLGFGIVEFLFYVFLLHAPFEIRLPALLFHATNTSIVGYGIAKNKPWRFYLLAVSLHALNNVSAIFGFWYIGGIFATVASYFFAWYFFQQTTNKTIDHWLHVER